ncbi:MAG: PAS domain-containing protein, partial [Proteobacteria bacterium]|nr:PAS domain-containing protein [Pseudomonadota bacterium]
MSGGDNRRLKRLRKTKAQLVDELEALERKHAKRKLDADGGKGSGADALLEIEGPFRALLDNSPTAVFVRDVEGRYRFVNRAYEEWYKVDREKILGKTPYDIFKLETADLIIAFHNEVLESGTRIEREVQTILADGSTRSQWAIKFPLMSTDGKTIGVCGILSDLSDKERAEKAIQESEERFRAVVECSPGAIVIRDLEGRNVIANKTFCDWHGVAREDILGKSAHDFLAKEIADQIAAQERKVIETGTIIDEERRVTYPTGVTREIFSQKFPILGPEGDCVAVGTVINDITDRKRAEEANRESEQRLRGAIDSLQEGFALYDADDRLIAFNKKYEHLRPYAQAIMERGGTFEDVLRANIKHEIIPEFVGREEAYVQERLKQHKNPKDPIIRRFKDGTWSMIEEVKTPDGGTAITLIDITEVKRAEEALRKNEALLRAVVDYSPAKIHIKDVEGRYTLINKEAEKLFGITDDEGRGKTSYDLFPKEVADAFMAHDQAVIESGEPTEGEEEFELEDGVHTFLTVKFPIYDLDGVSAVGAIGTDITERKQAEGALRESEERFRA